MNLMAKLATLLALSLLPFLNQVAAQGAGELEYYSSYYGRYVSRVSGGTLSVQVTDTPQDFTRAGCENGNTVCGHWEGTSTASVSELELSRVEIQQGCCNEFGLTSKEGFGMLLPCKGGEKCFTQDGRFTGYKPPSSGRGPMLRT